MTIKKSFEPILEKWNLLKHPFYEAWTAGTLPVDALRVYTSEYGAFIRTLPEGWASLNDAETAQEELEHADMWDRFAGALSTQVSAPQIAETRDLVSTAQELFSQPASALGALYAFEAQQPATALSKLDGLKAHYSLPAEVEPYFEVHSRNWHESEKILAAIAKLSPADQGRARIACEQMAESLWNALSGIHNKTCVN